MLITAAELGLYSVNYTEYTKCVATNVVYTLSKKLMKLAPVVMVILMNWLKDLVLLSYITIFFPSKVCLI